ncbi:phosphoglycerate mutase [Pseudoduganella sp. FT25W]|uniref:Phosphoglycerate mutase n=1 Tax=Duganella alba TaxID=2666081 RepID=A0A6L5QPA4_9BURK|nr:histidine phosphatase family protein [Duganella alba]MRX11694.1 phosphoglycerate mutase [Duganella alba]MRX20061.1 phosphoglycerate mutase [Duganella alba]
MQLILVRHPQPLVAPGVCYGSTDLAIAPGHLEQTLAALTLPANLPIYSSPLRRCAELAERLTPSPRYDQRLVEMHFGDWEMQPWDAIPRAAIDAWAADMVHYHPGGGESVLQVAERIAAFYRELTQDAIIICHAGAMRLLFACHAGLPPAAMALQAAQTAHQIPYGAMLTLKPV